MLNFLQPFLPRNRSLAWSAALEASCLYQHPDFLHKPLCGLYTATCGPEYLGLSFPLPPPTTCSPPKLNLGLCLAGALETTCSRLHEEGRSVAHPAGPGQLWPGYTSECLCYVVAWLHLLQLGLSCFHVVLPFALPHLRAPSCFPSTLVTLLWQ